MKRQPKCAHREINSNLICKSCGVPVDLTAKRSKYGAKKITIDDIPFDSLREGKRYAELKLRERAGEISELIAIKSKLRIPLTVHGIHICDYEADFQYWEDGEKIIEDSKGCKTAVYRIKKKLLLACRGIEVRET